MKPEDLDQPFCQGATNSPRDYLAADLFSLISLFHLPETRPNENPRETARPGSPTPLRR